MRRKNIPSFRPTFQRFLHTNTNRTVQFLSCHFGFLIKQFATLLQQTDLTILRNITPGNNLPRELHLSLNPNKGDWWPSAMPQATVPILANQDARFSDSDRRGAVSTPETNIESELRRHAR
jgi:hypothetical protein